MKIGRRTKQRYAAALAVLLGVSGMGYIQTQAANGIVLNKKDCSITISANNSVVEEETAGVTIPVRLYQVADVDASGRFTSLDGFPDVNEPDRNQDGSVTAEEWKALADEAESALSEDAEPAGEVQLVMEPAPGGEVSARPVTMEGLSVGMYLVAPGEVYNDDYSVQYTFEPYLTALPSSEYTLTGAGSDEWNYETEIGLKAEAVPQTGSLRIVKNLETYNASLGPVTCVFQVEGTDRSGNLYSNVISAVLDGMTGEAVLENIPAGMAVTVTEVYSGASYQLTDADGKTAVIVSEEGIRQGVNDGATASVSFTNDYDGGNRSGNGVVNHFEKDENDEDVWIWTQR